MQADYRALAQHYNWWPDTACTTAKLNTELKSWATDKGSLTAALIDLSDDNFTVNPLHQKITTPYFHEQRKLDRPLHKAAMIREVELRLHNVPVVFARSIIPLELLMTGSSGLANLGRTPLGHLLFKDGRIRVSKRQFTTIDQGEQHITARRTPYDYHGSTILVAEFFLPRFSCYLD